MSDRKPDEPQDLRKELNQLWRTTLDQFDEIKNVIVRSSTAGKAKLDVTFLKRQREKLLAELGGAVLEAVRAGELSLPEQLATVAQRIAEVEEQIREQESEVERLLHTDEQRKASAGGEPVAQGEPADEAEIVEAREPPEGADER